MSGWLLLAAYAFVIAPAFAIVAWGALQYAGGRVPPRLVRC